MHQEAGALSSAHTLCWTRLAHTVSGCHHKFSSALAKMVLHMPDCIAQQESSVDPECFHTHMSVCAGLLVNRRYWVLQVAGALDRKERLLRQLRSMNDEAEKAGPDARKTQPSDTFRQAYADVVMQLKQVLACLCCLHALLNVCVPVARWG